MAEMAHRRRELIPFKGKSDRAPGGRRLLLRRHRARWPGAGGSQRRGQAQGESSQAQGEVQLDSIALLRFYGSWGAWLSPAPRSASGASTVQALEDAWSDAGRVEQ